MAAKTDWLDSLARYGRGRLSVEAVLYETGRPLHEHVADLLVVLERHKICARCTPERDHNGVLCRRCANERVQTLETALRHLPDNLRFAIGVLEAAAPPRNVDEGHYASRALTYLYTIRDNVLLPVRVLLLDLGDKPSDGKEVARG